jgi:hypothetical protein
MPGADFPSGETYRIMGQLGTLHNPLKRQLMSKSGLLEDQNREKEPLEFLVK